MSDGGRRTTGSATNRNALPPGTVLRDYTIVSARGLGVGAADELGSGGFSIVYLARHNDNPDWLYAIKEFFPVEVAVREGLEVLAAMSTRDAKDALAEGLGRFWEEGGQLRKFRHVRGVVSCVNRFRANGTAYLVMDYDDGLPLASFLRQREAQGRPATEEDLLAVTRPLLEALAVVHGANVLHRDIKPWNIFVRRADDLTGLPTEPVLIDFGAAKQDYLAHTRTQGTTYTPGYAAFEQESSVGEVGPWTDIYSVGATMWRMVAGGSDHPALYEAGQDDRATRVFQPEPASAVARMTASTARPPEPDPLPAAAELGAGRFSPQVLSAVDQSLAIYANDRPQSCDELLALLDSGSVHSATVGVGNVAGDAVSDEDVMPQWELIEKDLLELGEVREETRKILRGVAKVRRWNAADVAGLVEQVEAAHAERVGLLRGFAATVDEGRLERDLLVEVARNAGIDEDHAHTLIDWRRAARRRRHWAVLAISVAVVGLAVGAWFAGDIRSLVPPAGPPPDGSSDAGDAAEKAVSLPPVRSPDGAFRDCPECPEMVVVPAGRFEMGCDAAGDCAHAEQPVHEVRVPVDFALGRFEVTVREFRQFAEAAEYRTEAEQNPGVGCGTMEIADRNSWASTPGRSWRNLEYPVQDRQPVTCVTWSDARAYAAWLGARTGAEYRLPSEAEWEYAVRAGTRTRYHFGDAPEQLCAYANGRDQTKLPNGTAWNNPAECDDGAVYPRAVGSYQPNPLGLYDMHGNVWEWVEDCWNGSYAGAPEDGGPWLKGNCAVRVLRGGAWISPPRNLRAAYRFRLSATNRTSFAGFRVARTLAP